MSHRLENVGVTDGGRLFHALGGNEQLGTIDFSFDLVPPARHVLLARTQPDIADEQVADFLGGLLAILPANHGHRLSLRRIVDRLERHRSQGLQHETPAPLSICSCGGGLPIKTDGLLGPRQRSPPHRQQVFLLQHCVVSERLSQHRFQRGWRFGFRWADREADTCDGGRKGVDEVTFHGI